MMQIVSSNYRDSLIQTGLVVSQIVRVLHDVVLVWDKV
jgi:hypothetical protein